MAQKERFQNPAVGDQVKLRLFTYNSNNLADVLSVDQVDIYHLDPAEVTTENPTGRRLVESFAGSSVVIEDTGTHLLTVTLEQNRYVIGSYCDVWTLQVAAEEAPSKVEQVFQIYPNLWYTTPIPVVYDFDFRFVPNKMRHGSKQFLKVEIIPTVPTAGDLRQYYENLAIVSDLKISMELTCGDCVPAEQDLRLVLDKESVTYREKRFGFYQLDTEEMDCGLYDIWFQMDFGSNRYISERFKFQIYD